MHLHPIDGAVSRVAEGATAFAYRDGGWAGVILGVDPDPADAGLISQWARDYWQELHPTSAGGGYVNFLMSEGQDRVRAAYRGSSAHRVPPGPTKPVSLAQLTVWDEPIQRAAVALRPKQAGLVDQLRNFQTYQMLLSANEMKLRPAGPS